MHEQRESFPLDDVQMPGDKMPPRCRQFRFPGMHSDVGGAYLPDKLPFVQRAEASHRNDLIGAHQIFVNDIRQIEKARYDIELADIGVTVAKASLSGTIFRLSAAEKHCAQKEQALFSIPCERLRIHQVIRKRKLSPLELRFFGEYCHDSYAGFKPFEAVSAVSRNGPWESGGYLQFRTRYAGESLRLAHLQSAAANAADA
jgi:hypothetical protein